MQQSEKTLEKIELLKQRLNKLISERECLQDDEILEVSTLLDSILNEYAELLAKEKSKSKG